MKDGKGRNLCCRKIKVCDDKMYGVLCNLLLYTFTLFGVGKHRCKLVFGTSQSETK